MLSSLLQATFPLTDQTKVWLDFGKSLIDIVGPIVTAIMGFIILRFTKNLERSQWRSQKIIEKRIAEWDEIREELNDVFCYCARVGGWKELKPTDVIQRKRALDRKMHLARPYFSQDFFESYRSFVRTCFEEFQGHGVDAKIKSPLWEHQNAFRGQWEQPWDELFYSVPSTEEQLWRAHEAILSAVAAELDTRAR